MCSDAVISHALYLPRLSDNQRYNLFLVNCACYDVLVSEMAYNGSLRFLY